jgi:hypothetical protein
MPQPWPLSDPFRPSQISFPCAAVSRLRMTRGFPDKFTPTMSHWTSRQTSFQKRPYCAILITSPHFSHLRFNKYTMLACLSQLSNDGFPVLLTRPRHSGYVPRHSATSHTKIWRIISANRLLIFQKNESHSSTVNFSVQHARSSICDSGRKTVKIRTVSWNGPNFLWKQCLKVFVIFGRAIDGHLHDTQE